jgi:hypothetical protein
VPLALDEMAAVGVYSENMSDYYFGFSSIDQLRSWIYKDDWLVGLHDIGMLLAVYICEDEDVLVGNTQAIFKGNVSKTQHSILEYFSISSSKPPEGCLARDNQF